MQSMPLIHAFYIYTNSQLIGVDVVAGAYDDAGCQSLLKKWRKRGHEQSLPVLLSITSTNVQIIQFEWVGL